MRITELIGAGVIVLILVWIVIVPLAAIWAVNTLFAFGIVFSFWNWVAAAIIVTILHGGKTSKGK